MLSPVGRDLQAVRAIPGKAEAVDEKIEAIRRRLLHVQDFVAALASIGELDAGELYAEVDLVEAARVAVRAVHPRADRNEVKVVVAVEPEGEGTRALARVAPRAMSVLLRELMSQAVEASSRGSDVSVTVRAPTSDLGARIIVDDQGAPLPSSARRAFIALELDPSTYGRPSSIPLYVVAEIASAQGALVELADNPRGGLRVTITFPR
jgi:signal transduction histidine kinase